MYAHACAPNKPAGEDSMSLKDISPLLTVAAAVDEPRGGEHAMLWLRPQDARVLGREVSPLLRSLLHSTALVEAWLVCVATLVGRKCSAIQLCMHDRAPHAGPLEKRLMAECMARAQACARLAAWAPLECRAVDAEWLAAAHGGGIAPGVPRVLCGLGAASVMQAGVPWHAAVRVLCRPERCREWRAWAASRAARVHIAVHDGPADLGNEDVDVAIVEDADALAAAGRRPPCTPARTVWLLCLQTQPPPFWQWAVYQSSHPDGVGTDMHAWVASAWRWTRPITWQAHGEHAVVRAPRWQDVVDVEWLPQDLFVQHLHTHPDCGQTCDVCADRPVDALLQPCGHSLCLDCLLACRRSQRRAPPACPFCRTPLAVPLAHVFTTHWRWRQLQLAAWARESHSVCFVAAQRPPPALSSWIHTRWGAGLLACSPWELRAAVVRHGQLRRWVVVGEPGWVGDVVQLPA